MWEIHLSLRKSRNLNEACEIGWLPKGRKKFVRLEDKHFQDKVSKRHLCRLSHPLDWETRRKEETERGDKKEEEEKRNLRNRQEVISVLGRE